MAKRSAVAAREKSPSKKRRTGDKKDDVAVDQRLPNVETAATAGLGSPSLGKGTWTEVATPAAKEKVRASKKQVVSRSRDRVADVTSAGGSQAPRAQERRIQSVPTESSSARSKSNKTQDSSGTQSGGDKEVAKGLRHWVVVIFAFLAAMGILKTYNARTHQLAAPVVKEANKAFGGFLSFRPFFRPSNKEGAKELPAPSTQTTVKTTPPPPVDSKSRDREAAKRKAAEAQERAAKAKREREEEQRKQARLHKEQMQKEKAERAEKLRLEKEKKEKEAQLERERAAIKKRKEEEEEERARKAREEKAAVEKMKKKKEEEEERVRREKEKEEERRRAQIEKEKFDRGVAAEKARVLQAQKEAKEKEEAERRKRQDQKQAALQVAADAAKEKGNAAEIARHQSAELLKQKQKEKEKNKMLTMGGDYSHHEHDVAGLWRGARVVTEDRTVHDIQLTSPWRHHGQSIFAPVLAWMHHPAPPVNKLYSAAHPPQDYYSFAGPAGTVTIAFYTHVHLREIRLYHPYHDAQRAPKDFRVLGWQHNPTSRRHKHQEPTVLGHFRYLLDERQEMQYFELMRHRQKESLAAVTIEVTSNYHHDKAPEGSDSTEQENWTNLWRVQVIGQEVSQLAIA